jgi:mono/diheme cytochrome c family protein/rhodanese-related sulfurtransferase
LPLAAAELVPGTPAHHGAELYGRMCAVCHGEHGEGYKADQATALAQPDFLASATDQQIAVAIAHGRKGTTMSAWGKEFGGPLSHGDVSALVAFLRSWQHEPAVMLDESPALGNAASGKAIFERECERCHGPTAPNVRILSSQFLTQASDGYIRHALHTGRPPTTMQSYTQGLGKQGIEDVIAHLRNLPPPKTEPPVAERPEPQPFKPVAQYSKGPAPQGFKAFPAMTSVDVVGAQLARKAKMLLLDARVPSDYEMEHIAGAYNVPFYDPTPFLDKLPKSTWLVAYCGCPHAESGNLATALIKAGFTQVTVLDEGLWVWKERGHPMHKGREP